MVEASAGPGNCAGASTVVTPIPTFIPILFDVLWAVGMMTLFQELFDENERDRHHTVVKHSYQAIDMDDYLPTSLEEFDRRVVGTGVNT